MNKLILLICFSALAICAFSQDTAKILFQPELAQIAGEIKKEGLVLYRSERASWLATDILTARHEDMSKVKGHFSYPIEQFTQCVFFSDGDEPSVLYTVLFDSTFSPEKTFVGIEVRPLNETEKEYFLLRKVAMKKGKEIPDLKPYKNTNFNVVPLIEKQKKDVYFMTGSSEQCTLYYGNDMLMHFDNNLNFISAQKLHPEILTVNYCNINKTMSDSVHIHYEGFSPYITPTDICMQMLYQDLSHLYNLIVVSEMYISIWNSKTKSLVI